MPSWSLRIILALLVYFQPNLSTSKEVTYKFNLKYFNGSPDGVRKMILGVNGQFPGPTIRVQLYDYLTVHVTNSIQSGENTSIHWHGLEQFLTPFQDGPEQVTQCPIIPGTTQTYRFQILQSGTYWWHSHHSYQYVEGCWGSFIVENKRDPHRRLYDEELILTLNDWYHLRGQALADWYLSSYSQGLPPIPNSGMINGVGRYNCRFALLQGQTCQESLQRYPVFEVKRGKRYRIRVINTSAFSAFTLSIDNHRLTTIEVDGVDTVVVAPVDRVLIFPAQRYSFVVSMTGSKAEQFWIRADATGNFNFSPNTNPYPESYEKNVLGILRYKFGNDGMHGMKPGGSGIVPIEPPETSLEVSQGRPANHRPLPVELPPLQKPESNETIAPSENSLALNAPELAVEETLARRETQVASCRIQYEPLTSPNLPSTTPSTNPVTLNQRDCRPFDGRAPSYYNQSITINVEFKTLANGQVRGTFNGITYKVGQRPVLYQVLNGETIPVTSNPINTKYGPGVVIQLVVNSREIRQHPFHLHGHSFYVLGMGNPGEGDYNESIHSGRLNLDGVRRDTTHVPTNSWTVLRYHADNPGVWLFHCHNNWHFQAGLGLVFIEGGPAFVSQTFGTRLRGTEGVEVCRRAGITF